MLAGPVDPAVHCVATSVAAAIVVLVPCVVTVLVMTVLDNAGAHLVPGNGGKPKKFFRELPTAPGS